MAPKDARDVRQAETHVPRDDPTRFLPARPSPVTAPGLFVTYVVASYIAQETSACTMATDNLPTKERYQHG